MKNELIDKYLKGVINYPFKENNLKCLIIKTKAEEIIDFIKSLYKNYYTASYKEYLILFTDDDLSIKNFIEQLQFDFASSLILCEGLILNKALEKDFLNDYLNYLDEFLKGYQDIGYLNFLDPLNKHFNVEKILPSLLGYVNCFFNKDPNFKDIIKVYFDNNLNVSLTAKKTFYSRAAILFKFESFKKKTGIDLSNFYHAAALQMILNSR